MASRHCSCPGSSASPTTRPGSSNTNCCRSCTSATRERRLLRRIEIDDAYLGGERPGKRGRGAEHKFSFVAAVQTDEESHPQRVQLRRVSGFTLAEIRRYAQQAMIPRFLAVAVKTPLMPYRFLKMAEPYA